MQFFLVKMADQIILLQAIASCLMEGDDSILLFTVTDGIVYSTNIKRVIRNIKISLTASR